jgi:hypothetical protein
VAKWTRLLGEYLYAISPCTNFYHFRQSLWGWSYYLRLCPPSAQLLHDLCDVEPLLAGSRSLDFENYNILEWLKVNSLSSVK